MHAAAAVGDADVLAGAQRRHPREQAGAALGVQVADDHRPARLARSRPAVVPAGAAQAGHADGAAAGRCPPRRPRCPRARRGWRSGRAPPGRTPPARSSRSLPRTPPRPAVATTGRSARLARAPRVRGDSAPCAAAGARGLVVVAAAEPQHRAGGDQRGQQRRPAPAPAGCGAAGVSAAGTAARRAGVQHAAQPLRRPGRPAGPPATARRRRRTGRRGRCRARPRARPRRRPPPRSGWARRRCRPRTRWPRCRRRRSRPSGVVSGGLRARLHDREVVGAGVGGLVAGVLAVADRAPVLAAQRSWTPGPARARRARRGRRPCRAPACRRGRP